MTGGDLLQAAVAELYGSDPSEFVGRRAALVAQARAAGEVPAAKRIAGLRKPTRPAWVINRLVRAAPGVPSELASLGAELRAAQGHLDGAAIRELSLRRRQLIEALTRKAFTVTGQHAPPAGLRDEVAATLGAELSDPRVAERLAAATLERSAGGEGFGSAGRAGLRSRRASRERQAGHQPAAGATAARAPAPGPAQGRAERERRRHAALAAAEQAVADADRVAGAATDAERGREGEVQRLEEQLADARRDLANARITARRARTRQRNARQALDRLRR